jgi:hypothetical protein
VTNIPSAALRQLAKLSKRKEKLMAQIQDVDREMIRLQSRFDRSSQNAGHQAPVTVSRAAEKQRRHRRTKRRPS